MKQCWGGGGRDTCVCPSPANLEVGGTFVKCPLSTLPEGLSRTRPVESQGVCAHTDLPAVKSFGPALTSLHAGWLNSPGRVSGRGVQSGGFLGVGRASCRPPLARAVSQGPHCCSQQLGEISAAVGCQFSGWDGRGGRGGWAPGQECLNRVGLRGEVVCTYPFLPLETEQEKMKHEIPFKKECQSFD